MWGVDTTAFLKGEGRPFLLTSVESKAGEAGIPLCRHEGWGVDGLLFIP